MICMCPVVSGGVVLHRVECPLADVPSLRRALAAAEAKLAEAERDRDGLLTDRDALRHMLAVRSNHLLAAEASEKVVRERVEALEKALRVLVARLDLVHESGAFKAVWFCAFNHLGPYAGPRYVAELDAARAALEEMP